MVAILRENKLTTIKPYYFHLVRLFAPQDSTDRFYQHLLVNVALNTHGITGKQGTTRMAEVEVNFMIPYLPCPKQKSWWPSVFVAINRCPDKGANQPPVCILVFFKILQITIAQWRVPSSTLQRPQVQPLLLTHSSSSSYTRCRNPGQCYSFALCQRVRCTCGYILHAS